MSPLAIIAASFGFALAACAAWLVRAAWLCAVEGWEDEHGFHFGAPPLCNDNLCFSHEGAMQHDR